MSLPKRALLIGRSSNDKSPITLYSLEMGMSSSTTKQNLFELYLDFVKESESPVIFHRWSIMACMGAALGQQCWIPFGASRIFPNQYIMLIGEPGARKSSAIKRARKLLSKAGYQHFAAEKTTKEKFLLDLEGLEDIGDHAESTVNAHHQVMQNLLGEGFATGMEPHEMFIVADEFNDFMRCMDSEFHAMLGSLWDYDDESTPYKQRLKTTRSVAIYQPTVNILGGNTHTGFSDMFPPQAIGQGFLSRLLLIFSEPSGKKIAFPPEPDPKLEAALIQRVKTIRDDMKGPVRLSRQAKEALEVLYNSYQGFADMRFTGYFTRRYTHLLKLCLLCAVVDLKIEVGIDDVILANTILRYAEHFMPRALGEFGKAKNADVATKILSFLTKEDRIVNQGEIWKQVSSDLERIEDLDKMLMGLKQAGKILWIPQKVGGIQGFTVVKMSIKSMEAFVNYDLLREYKQVSL